MLVLIILQKRERHSSQCRMVSDGNTWLCSDLLFIAPLSSIIVTTTKVVLLATYAVRRSPTLPSKCLEHRVATCRNFIYLFIDTVGSQPRPIVELGVGTKKAPRNT